MSLIKIYITDEVVVVPITAGIPQNANSIPIPAVLPWLLSSLPRQLPRLPRHYRRPHPLVTLYCTMT